MKYFWILIVISILSCSTETHQERTQSEQSDSIRNANLKDLFFAKEELSKLHTTDSAKSIELEIRKRRIDSLIIVNLDLKEGIIDQEFLKIQVSDLQSVKTQIKVVNDSLLIKNSILSRQLDSANQQKQNALAEGVVLKSKVRTASQLLVTGVSVYGIGISTPLFGKPKDYTTDKHDKIKKVSVSFILPNNSLATKENKHVNVIIYSTDRKDVITRDTLVHYQGIECKILLYLLPKEVKSGSHQVDIFINNKLEAQTNLFIK